MWRKIQQKIWRNSNGKLLPIYNLGSVQNMNKSLLLYLRLDFLFTAILWGHISEFYFDLQKSVRTAFAAFMSSKSFSCSQFCTHRYFTYEKIPKYNHILWFRTLHGKWRCQIKIELYGYNCSTNSVNIINVEL